MCITWEDKWRCHTLTMIKSLPEVMGHLNDHCTVEEGALLHWLVPRRRLSNGLRVLMDDQACIEMANNTEEGDGAKIYVEGHAVDDEEEEDDEDSNYEEMMTNVRYPFIF